MTDYPGQCREGIHIFEALLTRLFASRRGGWCGFTRRMGPSGAEDRRHRADSGWGAASLQPLQTWSWSLAGALRLSSQFQQGKIFLIARSDEAAWPLMASLKDGFQ